ncbi:cytochrome c oxidase assembly protein Cox16p, mitochondrial [Trichomonascus vanleenenianus]|uniref:Cox16p n=1 Tax=Trichomonascus vanleenenianus TaxID=2268995 RepID=UPI003ECB87F9
MSEKQREAYNKTWRGWYMNNLRNHSFLLFGLPFISVLTAGAYFLSYFTAVRYEQHDRKVTAMSEEEALDVYKKRRKVDMREEYYRLQQMDLDSWEQVRVPRFEGESENKW